MSLKTVWNMIKTLRSASKRNEFAPTWNDRIQPIDQAVLNKSRLWSDTPMNSISIGMSNRAAIEEEERKDNRIEKKPVDVVNEILTEKPVFSMADLKQQIKVIKKRIRVLEEQGVPKSNLENEYHSLEFLEARQKYPKLYELFKWPTTNQDKVLKLLDTYKLHAVEMKADGSGVENIPHEAIDEIEKYAKAFAKVTKKMPEFRLIVDEPTFQAMQAKAKKKDPILLALSPFGNWYYILGAWDEEVKYVDDLIYKGK